MEEKVLTHEEIMEKMKEVTLYKNAFVKVKINQLNDILEELSSIGVVIKDEGNTDFFIDNFYYSEALNEGFVAMVEDN